MLNTGESLLQEAVEIIEGIDQNEQDNLAWADAMQKILRKQSRGDYVVLCKVKVEPEEKLSKTELKEKQKKRKLKRKYDEMSRVKPNALERDYEQNLRRIATRGVVQLFTAVQKHQKSMESKLKKAKTEGKKEKVMKSVSKKDFLDMLDDDGGKPAATASAGDDKEPAWKVLREDFMPKGGMQDWNMEDDDSD